MAQPHDFGRDAEQRAAELLAGRGWVILHRNWRWHHKEIDLIARLGELVAFIEVKARSRTAYGHPLDAITWSKRRDLEAAAAAWVARFGRPADVYRFDAIWVLRAGTRTELQHVEDAWQL